MAASALDDADRKRIPVSAWLVGERIDLRAIDPARLVSRTPFTVRAGLRGLAVLYRYGAVVCFDLGREEEIAFLESIAGHVQAPFAERSGDAGELRIAPGEEERVEAGGTVVLHELSLERIQIVAEVLARSAVLAHYEARIGPTLEHIEPLVESLRRRGSVRPSSRKLLSQLGDVLLTEISMLGRAEIAEKPEITWERPALDRLYVRLAEEYELRDRDRAVVRKLELLSRTTSTLLDVLRNRRALSVEWYIVLLILVEIALALYERATS
jgi:uncharacterized Rmd1/YagE family protein